MGAISEVASAIPGAVIEEAVAWRRHLHRNPELAYEEHETAAFVAERLAAWDIPVRTGYATTGLVGTVSRGTSRKAIALRADMDALSILETSGVPHASQFAGKMHACGHDGHAAMLLAAARVCSELPLDGTVHFIFQPAEENEGGARRMIEDGLFRDFPVQAIFGLHNWPALPPGQFSASAGPVPAAFSTFEIEVQGRGAHGAMPHEGTDPILAASAVVGALQSIASRNVAPMDVSVGSVTQIHSGDAWNVIPESCTLRGTAR